MSDRNKKPLLTFALVSCNQAQFVREAVEGAFAQTYSPLEIILSDDCSDDDSFEIMREMAAAYRGPHRVVLSQNPVRRKTGGHVNKVMELAQGELIVIAAADDVSLLHRTQVVYEAWHQSGRDATSLYSDVIQIDENGRSIEHLYQYEQRKLCASGQFVEEKADPLSYVQTLKPALHGCAHIISPRLFRVFGNLPEQVMYEDKVLAFRSILAGKVIYINEPLVKYRLHEANVFKYRRRVEEAPDLKSLEGQESRLLRGFRDAETMCSAFIHDLNTARQQQLIGEADFNNMVQEAERQRKHASFMGNFLESGFFRKCFILLQLGRCGIGKGDRSILLKRLLPRSVFLRIRLARSRAALVKQSAGAGITDS